MVAPVVVDGVRLNPLVSRRDVEGWGVVTPVPGFVDGTGLPTGDPKD